MVRWWDKNFERKLEVELINSLAVPRINEPVRFSVNFKEPFPHQNSLRLVDDSGSCLIHQLVNQKKNGDHLIATDIIFIASVTENKKKYYLYYSSEDMGEENYTGIRKLNPKLKDGIVRLDTGKYVIELCKGTARGSSSDKWGIRYFEEKHQGRNLIRNCTNAIGGVYGPFFTAENGWINPPAHTILEWEIVTEGPLCHCYRTFSKVPNGLDENLNGKSIRTWWTFYFLSDRFDRRYVIDDYETIIDGRLVRNKMTVGDELECGPDNLFFSAFKSYGQTKYRKEDPYLGVMLSHTQRVIDDPKHKANPRIKEILGKYGTDASKWSWDASWRLFCPLERVFEHKELKVLIEGIKKDMKRAIGPGSGHNVVYSTKDFVSVPEVEGGVIFALDANKTVEHSPITGYSFAKYVDNVVQRFEIAQKNSNGWVNWGTNGENEYPELPSGSTISSAYDKYEVWEDEVDKMETPIGVSVRKLETLEGA